MDLGSGFGSYLHILVFLGFSVDTGCSVTRMYLHTAAPSPEGAVNTPSWDICILCLLLALFAL